MTLSIEEVERIAALAMLELSHDEKELLRVQLAAILEHVELLNEVDIEGIEPTSSVNDLLSVLRDDKVEASMGIDQVFLNSNSRQGDQFLVQPVMDSEQ